MHASAQACASEHRVGDWPQELRLATQSLILLTGPTHDVGRSLVLCCVGFKLIPISLFFLARGLTRSGNRIRLLPTLETRILIRDITRSGNVWHSPEALPLGTNCRDPQIMS